jgi:hypothetical protein
VFVGATGQILFALMATRFTNRQELVATHSACLMVQHFSKIALFGLAKHEDAQEVTADAQECTASETEPLALERGEVARQKS